MNAKIQSVWDILSGRAAPLWVVAVCALAYSNALGGPFVFDDLPAIVKNQHLPPGSFTDWFAAPGGSTASGRPLVALSFALNHALSGLEVTGWHLTNLALHVFAAVALLLLARDTLAHAGHERSRELAFSVAVLWALHPLLSDAVNLVASRSELMVSLAYLSVLLCLTRSVGTARPWTALCVLASFCGMASKEVMVTAPLVALAWDRAFLSGSWRAAWTARRSLYLGLASSWLLLAACVLTADRGESVTLGSEAVSTLESLFTQAGALAHYVQLFLWPAPLSIDYAGWGVTRSITPVLPQVLCLVGLIGVALWRVRSNRKDGLLLLSFFAILAPSSSVIPLTGELVAEHRMYLASAPLVALAVTAVQRYLGSSALLAATVLLAPVLLMTTRDRNEDWSSAHAIWQSATQARPTNARAWNSFGLALKELGDALEKEERFNAAVAAKDEAVAAWHQAIAHDPDNYNAHGHLGEHFMGPRTQDLNRAIHHNRRAVEGLPSLPKLRFNLGSSLLQTGDAGGAEAEFTEALRLAPDSWIHRGLAERLLARAREQR